MRIITLAGRIPALLFRPIRLNAVFFVFMFVLGLACNAIEVPCSGASRPYPLAPHELLVDLYVLCVVLALLPGKVRRWVRGVLCTLLYIVSLTDVYCFVKFGTVLTPTVLMLIGETTGGEASEFLSSYLSWGVVTGTPLKWILIIIAAHIACAAAPFFWRRYRHRPRVNAEAAARIMVWTEPLLGVLTAVLLVISVGQVRENRESIARLMSYDTIGLVEREMTRNKPQLYHPAYRLVFSIYANRLAAQQLDKLVEKTEELMVDSCSFRSRDIVLIIGESYNRHHSQLYGYDKPTTPRQKERAADGSLTVFSDVVAPWNLTSYVFKHVFSLYTVGDPGDWCDYPLFPELFRKAGYHVTFITNQFLPQPGEAVYDFSGGFFLNNPVLDKAQFDTRNTSLHKYDEGLLADYDTLKSERTEANLTIFHLYGQHLSYKDRLPDSHKKFKPRDYYRPDLDVHDRWVIADYDNATLYNDSIVDQIIRRFEDKDAIVIYMPDHGEECFWRMKGYGRMHNEYLDYRMAHEEFEIPLWIWCSPAYAKTHPDVVAEIKAACNRPFMTDRLPHVLLYLAGISCPDYRPENNLLGDGYNAEKPRLLRHRNDYDKLRERDGGK